MVRGRFWFFISERNFATSPGLIARGISPPRRRGTFPAMGKYPKDRRGTAQNGHFVSIFALPPDPHYGGRVLVRFCKISGAQNLSGWSKFPPGHWALASPKLQAVRFQFRAWLYRANAPGVEYAVGAGVLTRPPGFQICSREAVGAALAVACAGCGIGFRSPL